MNFNILQYNAWEAKQLVLYSQLLEKYTSLKQKEGMMLEAKEGKVSRKDILLKFKGDNTISKLGNAELEYIEKEDVIQGNYDRNILIIQQRREKKLKEAEEEYERSFNYYNNERDKSLAKTKREYDSKKRTLESRGESIEQERNISIKSASEITLEKQKYDILKQMNDSIEHIKLSRDQLPKDTLFNTTIPDLPEALSKTVVPQNRQVPQVPKTPKPESSDLPSWVFSVGEDASLAILREESRREDAKQRKEAAEEDMKRQERAYAYRMQLEREAEERKIRNQEYENKKDEEYTEEEIQRLKEKNRVRLLTPAKKTVKKV